MNKTGSLYQVKKFYWLLFPSKKTGSLAVLDVEAPSARAAYWSEQLKCNVSYVSPNDLVVLLETDGKYKKILSCNGEVGWTWFADMFNEYFEEVTAE